MNTRTAFIRQTGLVIYFRTYIASNLRPHAKRETDPHARRVEASELREPDAFARTCQLLIEARVAPSL